MLWIDEQTPATPELIQFYFVGRIYSNLSTANYQWFNEFPAPPKAEIVCIDQKRFLFPQMVNFRWHGKMQNCKGDDEKIDTFEFPAEPGFWVTFNRDCTYVSQHFNKLCECDHIIFSTEEAEMMDLHHSYLDGELNMPGLEHYFKEINRNSWLYHDNRDGLTVYVWIEKFRERFYFNYGTEHRYQTAKEIYAPLGEEAVRNIFDFD